MNKPFDINLWDYPCGRELVNGRIHKHNPKFYSQGGKSLGLRLCENIARLGTHLTVPAWSDQSSYRGSAFAMIDIHAGLEAISQGPSAEYIIRSNEATEDWVDPRSGVHESKCYGGGNLGKEITLRVINRENFILQRRVSGIGFVVDIGYSELLGRPIARVAHGRKALVSYGEPYSSATWDGQSLIGIYEITGEPIVPLTAYPEFVPIIPGLVRELVNGLTVTIGTEFGMQFELVIDPAHTEKWHLVQIRPTPDAIRGMRARPEIHGELLCTTGKVSRAGVAQGQVSFRTMASSNAHDLKDRIVAWDQDMLGKWGGEMDQLIEAKHAGALAHITERCWMMNSAHGQFYHHSKNDNERIEEVRKLLVVAPPHNSSLIHELFHAAFKQEITLRLVSDGLVGQIFRL